MENLQKFSEFRLNENWFTDIWKRTVKLFNKKYKKTAWWYLLKFLKGKDELPKGVEVKFAERSERASKDIKESRLNEEIVELTHADVNILNEEADEIQETIKDAYEFRLSQNKHAAVFIWGAPGIGKTQIVEQVGDELNLDMIVFHLSQIEPTEFRGVPKIENIGDDKDDSSTERTVNKLPKLFPTDNGPAGKGGILFLDELNRAPKMVLSAALPLCLEGKIGDYEMPSKWIIVAAGNRKEDIGFDATEIEPALANRFQHVNFLPTVERWSEWASDKEFIDPQLVAFLNFDNGYFHKLDAEEGSSAWPSPRSWSLASEAVYVKSKNFNIPKESMFRIYAKLVGVEAATAFLNYLKLINVFSEQDIENVYKKGAKAKKIPTKRLDEQRAIINAIAYYKKGEKLTPEELKNVLEFAANIEAFETKTALMSNLKLAHTKKGHCYLKEEEPWKKIWWEYAKKWHENTKEL